MFPGEEVGKLLRADESVLAQGVQESVAKEVYGWREAFLRHAVEGSVGGEESVGG
jgi:hypothetical protein